MAVRLRLARVGRKKVPFYRVVAIDSRKPRDGEALDILGTYDALNSKLVTFDVQGVQQWIARGAQMADSVKRLYKMARSVNSAQ